MNSTKLPTYKRLACAALIAAMASPTVAAESAKPAYTMMVVTDTSQGRKILSGSFESAIQKLAPRQDKSGAVFETNTNLCVAYAKAKALEEATAACDSALMYLEDKSGGPGANIYGYDIEDRQIRANLSVALSNRGVLYAVEGEISKAQENFKAARKLDAHSGVVDTNLARLQIEMNTENTAVND